MFIEILKNTPWWVYLIFIYLMTIGVKSLKKRTVSIYRMFLVPIILLIWSLYTLSTKLHSAADIFLWFFALLLGIFFGWQLTLRRKIEIDRKAGLLTAEGSPLTFILLLIIFSAKYFFGYTYATDPDAYNNPMIVTLDLLISGVVTGMFFGRVLHIWTKWKQ